MIIKILLLISLLASFNTSGDDCINQALPEDFIQVGQSLGRVNCNKVENFLMDSEAEDGGETCRTCKSQFISAFKEQHSADHSRLLESEQNVFVKALFNELQKSIAITTSEMLTLENVSSGFTESINACNTSQFVDKVKGCSALEKAGIRPENLSNLISTDIARSLKPFNPPACSLLSNLSQRQVAKFSSSLVVRLVNDDLISVIEAIPNDSFIDNLDIALQSSSEFKGYLEKDPVFKVLKQNPEQFKHFFTSLRNLSESDKQARLESFRSSPEVVSKLDSSFHSQCERSYKSFIDTVCARDFTPQHIELGNLANYSKVSFDQFDDVDFASDPKVEARNFELLSFCSSKDNPSSKYNLTQQLSEMNNWMLNDKKGLSLKSFEENLNREKENFNQRICEADCASSPNSTECYLKTHLQNLSNSGTPLARTQYSGGALELIRSITGTPTKISTEDREVLVSYGILPQEDGSYVTPTPAPQGALASATSGAGSTGAASGNGQASGGSRGAASRTQFAEGQASSGNRRQGNTPASAPISPFSSSAFSEALADQLSDISDLTNQERQRFADFERELGRRLSQGSPASAPTRSQVQQAAQNIVRERGSSLSPARQQQFLDRSVAAYDSAYTNPAGAPAFANGGVNLGNDLAGPSQSYTNEQQAKMAMSAAQAARRSGGSAGAVGSGGLGGSDAGRAPASVTESDASLSVRITLDELEANPQRALAQLPPTLPETFYLEVQGASEVYRYQVNKSGDEFQISQVLGGNTGQAFIQRIERLLLARTPGQRASLERLRKFTGEI